MKALIQRVKNANVVVDGKEIGAIGKGLMVLFGVGKEDENNESKIKTLGDKICNMRIFEDENGKMNKSLLDIGGEMLIVSQFTLYADTSGGRRPSFINAAHPDIANDYYEKFIKYINGLGVKTGTGKFGAEMAVSLINDGPVTIMVEC